MSEPKKFPHSNSSEAPERKTTYGPGPNTKGGGFRGGPKRWTGGGPAPARHIPWPEIFKHHISVIEGHVKMVDMVRKHTAEGSGNWNMICGCLDRAKEMMSTSKYISRSFIPPPNHREKVPIGSSSASMYPGYSPADHEYGKAAEDYGKYASEARQRGETIGLPGVEYDIGQAKGIKRPTLAGIREAKRQKESSGSGSGSGSDAPPIKTQENGQINGNPSSGNTTSEAPEQGDNPYFVIDTKPMKVDIPGVQAPKRSATPPSSSEKKHKKAKKLHDGALPAGEGFEDISEEVEAKLKEKEEKKKRKQEKKRKRETDSGSTEKIEESGDAVAEKPSKKKKVKHSTNTDEAGPASAAVPKAEEREHLKDGTAKRPLPDGESGDVVVDAETANKKDKKVKHNTTAETESTGAAAPEVEKADDVKEDATIKRATPDADSSDVALEAGTQKKKKQNQNHEPDSLSGSSKKRKGGDADGGTEGEKKHKKKK